MKVRLPMIVLNNCLSGINVGAVREPPFKAHGAQEPRRISKIRRGYEHRATKRFARSGN